MSPSQEVFEMRPRLVLSAAAGFALTAITVGAAIGAAPMMGPIMGPAKTINRPSFVGYYDGHKDTYLNTDVSSKADATAMHINYSARLRPISGLPEIYLVEGKAATGQLAVFGSEPGEKDYSPLWSETILTWKAGATPVVIKSDTQINKIEKTGKLTERDAHVVLNCPIIKVG
jgi:hypothetical protein